MTRKPRAKKARLKNHLMAAAELPASLQFEGVPSRRRFDSALAAGSGNPCAGAPAGTPCMVWTNPDGSTTICTCDGNGNCLFPS